MVRNSDKRQRNGAGKLSLVKGNLENDLDELFKLPLTEFIGARKTLAARLKQMGQVAEADRVKALVKPSTSAWAVNQLYWKHREVFERLLSTGQRFRQAQASRVATKVSDMRGALDARREALSDLSLLATSLLSDVGHNPTPDMLRRITTTLEGISAYASLPDGTSPGRLTHDVDPPGFESLASFVPGVVLPERKEALPRLTLAGKASVPTNKQPKSAPAGDMRKIEVQRQAKIAAAKVSQQDAKRVLVKARARAQSAEAAQKKADADVKEKEKNRREAEQRFDKAKAASEDAAQRARKVAGEVEDAAEAVENAERAVEKASKELASLS